MKLLLDEMISAAVAVELRYRGHDVVAVQDIGNTQLRGIADCTLLDRATAQQRAVVTDNVPDFFRCHHQRLDARLSHFGLLFFTNDTFPRHRHALFVSRILIALERVLAIHTDDDQSSWVRWLARP